MHQLLWLALFGSGCLLSGDTSNLPDTQLIRLPIGGDTWFQIVYLAGHRSKGKPKLLHLRKTN